MFPVIIGKFLESFLPPIFLLQPCHLSVVICPHRFLDGSDGIAEIAVAPSVFCRDLRWLYFNESLDQPVHIFFHGVAAHADGVFDGFVAWIAPKGFPVLAVKQIGVHCDLSCRKIEHKNLIRQRKIIFRGLALGISLVFQSHHPFLSTCLFAHSTNFSFGTMSRLPILRLGKSSLCINSYAVVEDTPNTFPISSAFRNSGNSS